MDQQHIEKYIHYFLKGKLEKAKEEELLQWIKRDKNNQKRFLEIQSEQSGEIIHEHDIEVSRKWKELHKKISIGNGQDRNRSIFLRVASVAAAFIIGIFSTILVLKYNTQLNPLVTEQNIVVPYGAKTNITLPDSTIVWLNAGSQLSYPSEFGKNRQIELSGEAFFEVKKDSKRFIVSTQFGEVEAKGTSFNVQAFSDETLYTTLESGIVVIRGNKQEEEVTLRPGQQAQLINDVLVVENVEIELFTSWREGKLIFRKEYLPEVVKRLERWYNVKIELENDPRLNEIWFTGTLEMETFSEVLELLKVTSPIQYVYNDKTRTIKIKYKQK